MDPGDGRGRPTAERERDEEVRDVDGGEPDEQAAADDERPRRGGDGGALTRYFGRRRGVDLPDQGVGEAVKTRGVECRQDDTPAWISRLQAALIRTLDRTHDVEAVVGELRRWLRRLEDGEVDPIGLLAT